MVFVLYFMVSDWFYFDGEIVLCQFKDYMVVIFVDLFTNWIKLVSEIINFISFLILIILLFIPIHLYIILAMLLPFNVQLFGFIIKYCFRFITRFYV